MNILALLRSRFETALRQVIDDPRDLVDMVRPSQDARHGDYQANCAMPLGKQLGKSPREVAQDIVDRLDIADICEPASIAGPGFINLRLRDEWLGQRLATALGDGARLGIAPVERPRTYVIDYSSPNVAKPMHVGHIRSTVIGDSLYRVLKFLGHRTISDNHIGDWGTQFGMIIWGFKHFLDSAAYEQNPVAELGRLYRLVNRLVDYHEIRSQGLPKLRSEIAQQEAALREEPASSGDKEADKKAAKARRRTESRLKELQDELASAEKKLQAIDADAVLSKLAAAQPNIGQAVLAETAKLHAGDAENRRLWHEFLPPCLVEIERTYQRLAVTFDIALGESFYHDRLAGVVADLRQRKIAQESNGAICVFLPGHETPLIVQKQDGAFLYATTDLATIQYRMEEFQPDAILYVVDHRQSLHFEQLFATAQRWGYEAVELEHVSFGTVLGQDGRPYKTREGDAVGLSSLLDEAVRRAFEIVTVNNAELAEPARRDVAEVVGIGALKYADLAHNRTSDYTFDYDKMLAMNGNTATYMQYAYARVRSIFAKGEVDEAALRADSTPLQLAHPAERALGLELLRFADALDATTADYRPDHLTDYLYQVADRYSSFFDQCPVLKADSPAARASRLKLCDLTARTLRLGLELLSIRVVEKM